MLPGPGYWLRGEQWVRKVVDAHPEGATETAYSDPDEPAGAFLGEDTSPWPPASVGVGAPFAGPGVRRLVGELG